MKNLNNFIESKEETIFTDQGKNSKNDSPIKMIKVKYHKSIRNNEMY